MSRLAKLPNALRTERIDENGDVTPLDGDCFITVRDPDAIYATGDTVTLEQRRASFRFHMPDSQSACAAVAVLARLAR